MGHDSWVMRLRGWPRGTADAAAMLHRDPAPGSLASLTGTPHPWANPSHDRYSPAPIPYSPGVECDHGELRQPGPPLYQPPVPAPGGEAIAAPIRALPGPAHVPGDAFS